MLAAAVVEMVPTAVFVVVILGSTDRRFLVDFAPIFVGLALVLIYLISILVTSTSANPAGSLGIEWFAGSDRDERTTSGALSTANAGIGAG